MRHIVIVERVQKCVVNFEIHCSLKKTAKFSPAASFKFWIVLEMSYIHITSDDPTGKIHGGEVRLMSGPAMNFRRRGEAISEVLPQSISGRPGRVYCDTILLKPLSPDVTGIHHPNQRVP